MKDIQKQQPIIREEKTILRLNIPSLKLTRNDVKDLWAIVSKATEASEHSDTNLYISGSNAYVLTCDIERFTNPRWPQDIEVLDLIAQGDENSIRVKIDSFPSRGNRVEIIGLDPDWLSARVNDFDDYFKKHKSWYWVFHSKPTLITITLIFGAIASLIAWLRFNLEFQWVVMVGMLCVAFSEMILIYVFNPLYPYNYISGGEKSTKGILRVSVNYILSAIVGGIIFTFLSLWWSC